MSISNNPSKIEVTKLLKKAVFSFGNEAESWTTIDETLDLPEALYVAAKGLPLISILLKDLESSLDSKESDELKDKYTAIYRFADLCLKRIDYLKSIVKAVTSPGDPTPKEEKYREAAETCGGIAIEAVMKDLLQRAINLATSCLTDDYLKSSLQAVLEEVVKLKPSLEEGWRGQVSLRNYGQGNQFYHGGRGNQNHSQGGNQFTGNGYTLHMGSGE
ncbi:hypothetical protein A0O28_0023590 [Trichoderma guizhouense]|uniref:NACHT-NTPase and P-loop NTPases N-terminal domain-containing protein n=1 Tax=Trichoderma guizhouense TaxID=1491466 RepID=A0A1T3CSH8_9HYPO|nr:hypothetical protein A0O28_0023590 [Trichoderma guizhouense]